MGLVRLHRQLKKLSPGFTRTIVARYRRRLHYGTVLKLLAIVVWECA